jgi:hypothetical protein
MAGCFCRGGPGCCLRQSAGFVPYSGEERRRYLEEQLRELEVSVSVREATKKLVEQYKDTLVALARDGD